jgi:hypothetical protein
LGWSLFSGSGCGRIWMPELAEDGEPTFFKLLLTFVSLKKFQEGYRL